MELTNTEMRFAQAYIWETIHLEMDGPAHRLARQHGVSDWQISAFFSKFPDVQKQFAEKALIDGPRIEAVVWPWTDNDFPKPTPLSCDVGRSETGCQRREAQ
ncbi:MAG: hypothetical protein KatS3mg105_4922 [Gemmatales bacterium]|nr:MAG: hypothetical protein KatS3mg105_4922 [Gemmatales bacterium]